MELGGYMAGWIKEISHPEFGIPVSYWECWSVFYDHQHQLSTITVAGWQNQADKEAGKIPLMKKSWEIASGTNPQLAAGAVQFLTAFARSQAEFVNSQEVE